MKDLKDKYCIFIFTAYFAYIFANNFDHYYILTITSKLIKSVNCILITHFL